MRKRILLDTDIGNDIDDAVCLAYLLANPRSEILGITTVSGEPEKRAQMASAMCIVAGKDIPIYPGAPLPFLIDQQQQRAPQSIALKKWEHRVDFPQGQAVDFLRRTIHANPGEITLLTIGPLTNIALLFLLDPEIPSLLNELVMMCGIFTNRLTGFGPREWNAMLDPHATAVVYKMRPKIHRSIGLDGRVERVLPVHYVPVVLEPSQNRACATNAHGSSCKHLQELEQTNHYSQFR